MSMRRLRITRLVLAVLVGIVLAVGIDVARAGGPRLWLAKRGLPPPYLPQGERIQVGSGSFYIDCRGSGSPTVVLEAGAGGGAGSWSGVFEDIAATTRACAYDRAGLGSSDPRGTRSLGDAAADLRALLDAAGEPAPFVIVGHSLGGAYARIFGSEHPEETPAIVLVDSFDPDLESRYIHPLLEDLRPEYEARLQGLRDVVASWENLDWVTSEEQLASDDLSATRVAALVAPRYEPRLSESVNARIERAWREAYDSLSPGRTTYEYAWNSGHVIPVDRPDAVVDVVRRVVAEIRE
jgi:pimeloyl-ACP methyl ester carboxylesterase